jgi:sirohydrochlorin ferrochelatase
MLTYANHRVGLIIVDHGSKKAAANDLLIDVAALFKRVANADIVEPAHMELADPTIEQAFDRCVALGATLVVVHPYFLAPGRHSTTDIPRMTAAAAAKHPAVQFHVTQPLGLDEKLATLMLQRIDECLKQDLDCNYCRATGCCGGGATLPAGETVAH